MGTAIKHPVPDRVKSSIIIFDIRTLWRSALGIPWAPECADVKNYKRQFNPVWHRMLYSCTHYPYGNSGRQRAKRSLLW